MAFPAAVLLDTSSIQKYIFGGRKLKENIGASHIVKGIFDEPLRESLRSIFPGYTCPLETWETEPSRILTEDPHVPVEVGYIGGGNALLFFKDSKEAENFIYFWTQSLLVDFPGIVPAAALEKAFDLSDNGFQNSLKELFELMESNKREVPLRTSLARFGITSECRYSGLAQEAWQDTPDPSDAGYVSAMTKTKLNYVEEANSWLEETLLTEKTRGSYCLTDELDSLGQTKNEENYIAIVHTDGDGIGTLFRELKTLNEVRRISTGLKKATIDSFRKLIDVTIAHFDKIKESLGHSDSTYPKSNNKFILPLRPIIIGGDDVAFVCHGKLGIYYANLFLEAFLLKTGEILGESLSACAGITVTKTHYPFYRSYELSEELCRSSKKTRRANGGGSWLDFHIAYGGFTGDLSEIRERHYSAPQGHLCMRPYKIGVAGPRSFQSLLECASLLRLPKSKVQELRKVIGLGPEQSQAFLSNLKIRAQNLPPYPGGDYHERLWVDGKTPYFDMVELMEFYPDFALPALTR